MVFKPPPLLLPLRWVFSRQLLCVCVFFQPEERRPWNSRRLAWVHANPNGFADYFPGIRTIFPVGRNNSPVYFNLLSNQRGGKEQSVTSPRQRASVEGPPLHRQHPAHPRHRTPPPDHHPPGGTESAAYLFRIRNSAGLFYLTEQDSSHQAQRRLLLLLLRSSQKVAARGGGVKGGGKYLQTVFLRVETSATCCNWIV